MASIVTSDSEPKVLFHYTSLDVLAKILTTRQLWASSTAYLNDSSERVFYQEKAQVRLQSLLRDRSDLQIVEDALPHPPTPPWDFDRALGSFVTSFSSETNSLSQWRAYTPPGVGVQVGFKTACLKNAQVSFLEFGSYPASHRRSKITFGKVVYLNRLKPEIDDHALLEEYRLASESFTVLQKDELHIGRFDDFLSKRLGAVGCLYKDDSFRAESEYRLIAAEFYWPYVPVHFRTAKSTLIPFMKLDIPRSDGQFSGEQWDAIESIKIGPTPAEKLTMPALAALLMTRGCQVKEISNSDIPYREI